MPSESAKCRQGRRCSSRCGGPIAPLNWSSRPKSARACSGDILGGSAMDHSDASQTGTDAWLKKLHDRPHLPLGEWLRAPAHVHYKAFRMSDPPTHRAASRSEFQSLLAAFKVP